jgi:hypothetical protein
MLTALAVSSVAAGQVVLDSAMCLSLPPNQRVAEFRTDAGIAYVWTLLGSVSGKHTVRWEWIGPSGRVQKADGPVAIGVDGGSYPAYPLTQSLALTDAAVRSQPGTWQVKVYVDEVSLATEAFEVVSVTSVGDYGDAPDGGLCGYASDPAQDVLGRFPTRYDTTNSRVAGEPGAHALIGGEEALGDPRLTSLEKGADDANDPDGTPNLVDDDTDDGLSIELLADGSLGFSVTVTAAPNAATQVCYLNAVYDVNRDGEWRNTASATEWIIKNQMVNVLPGGTQKIAISLPVGSDWLVSMAEPRWLRLVLSDSPVSESLYASMGGWDGSGQFERGEVEDYKIGVASAHDIAWAARQASRVSWASARAHAFSLAWSFSQAVAKADAIAIAYAQALAYVQVAADAKAHALAQARAAADAYARAIVEADAFALAHVTTPCASLTAWASASVTAIVEASASASASAAAAAAAAAEAHAQALAYADALAVALADAQATAASFAAAVASAYAAADAYAASGASAVAWADAWSHAVGTDALATAHALAWAQARAWATTSVSASTSASTWTLALSYAEAIAQAAAYAEATVLAIAEASASADAWAAAAAEAYAIANVSILAITNAAAGASAAVIEDCCGILSIPCDCDSCCPACQCPSCDSCCNCPSCDSCCDPEPPACDTYRDTWSAIPHDTQDAIIRLAYVTGQDGRSVGDPYRRYTSKSDVKYDVDLWQDWPYGDRQIQRDADAIERFLTSAIGDKRTQLVNLWQTFYDLGYSGSPLPECVSDIDIPCWQ